MNFRATSPPGTRAASTSDYEARAASPTEGRWVRDPPGTFHGEVTTATDLENQIAKDRGDLTQMYVNNTIFIVGGGIIQGFLVEATLEDPLVAIIAIPYAEYYLFATQGRYQEVRRLESKISHEENLLRVFQQGEGSGYWEAPPVWYIDDAPRK